MFVVVGGGGSFIPCVLANDLSSIAGDSWVTKKKLSSFRLPLSHAIIVKNIEIIEKSDD